MNDGPEGYRASGKDVGTTTQWPSGLTLAHSFDPALMLEWGKAMGQEFYNKAPIARTKIVRHRVGRVTIL